MEKGKAAETISRPICLPEQTGNLSSSQEDEITLVYRDNGGEMGSMMNSP